LHTTKELVISWNKCEIQLQLQPLTLNG